MMFSLLGHLLIGTYCVLKYLKLENFHGQPGPQLDLCSNKCGKNISFLDENIPYLEGGRGGGRGGFKSLNQKNLPHVVFTFLGPPCLLQGASFTKVKKKLETIRVNIYKCTDQILWAQGTPFTLAAYLVDNASKQSQSLGPMSIHGFTEVSLTKVQHHQEL